MVRSILIGLSAILILLNTVYATNRTQISTRDEVPRPVFNYNTLKEDLSIKFFVEAASDDLLAPGTVIDIEPYNHNDCIQESKLILQAIGGLREWGLQFPDSWGRLPIGLFWGHQISMGAYRECLEIRHYKTEEESSMMRGQYCLAKIPVAEMVDQVIPWSIGPGDAAVEKAGASYKLAKTKSFDLGMCIPKSCSPAQADKYMKSVFEKTFNARPSLNEPIVRDGKYCDYEKPIEWSGLDIFAIVFFSVIACFMILSSIYDLQMTKQGKKGKDLFMAFSVVTNARKLFRVNDNSKNPNIIECMNGIRCFSMMWVIFGHGYMTFYELPHINRNKFYTWTQTPYSILVQNATLCVDSFFFMSGLLMLWGAFREMERTKGKLNIGLMYFHRYIRLTPVVAVVVLFIVSLYRHTGFGPMWMRVGRQHEICSETWWATLLFVQNYVFPYNICMSQTWYLAVDTQLYVLSPLVLIPLWKWGKKAVAPIAVVLLLCLGCTFATFMVNDFTLFRVDDDNVGRRQALTYYPTHTRIPSWLFGVLFGYFFYKYNRGKRIPLARHWIILGWVTAFGTMLACLWGPYWRLLDTHPNAPIIEGAFYEPLSRSAWAISVGWIIWACYNGHGGLINDFLSWGFFQAFARLSYSMYVIHRIVQWVSAGRIQTDTYFSNWDYIIRWWSEFGITLLASIIACLAFESPILGIEKAIFSKGTPPKKVEPTTTEEPKQSSSQQAA